MRSLLCLAAVLVAAACGSIDTSPSTDGAPGTPPNQQGPNDDGGSSAGDGGPAGATADVAPLPPWESLIDPGRLHQIRITVAPSDVKSLETLKGTDVPCTVTFDDVVIKDVGIHQKGSLYSGCRCLKLPCANPDCVTNPIYPDKVKPGLKLKLDAFVSTQRLFGLKRLVLNNAHQDLSFVSAHLIYEIYRRAGLVAPHTAFAQVVINGIPLGLYDLEEDTDKQFLQRYFGSAAGNLYESTNYDIVLNPDGRGVGFQEGANVQLDNEMTDMRSRDDLYALAGAILGAGDGELESKISKLMDLDAFLTLWAIDAVADWRDNYTFNRNNYLFYDNPKDGRIVFLPHGADGAMGVYTSPTVTAYPLPRGLVGMDLGGQLVKGMLAMAIQDVPALYTKYKAAVVRIGSAPVWDTKVLLDRVAKLDALLATKAIADARMTPDIAQFKKYRPIVEKFIGAYGTSRRPEPKPPSPPPPPLPNRTPVIFSAALSYPPVPATSDDLFDVAVLLAMPEVDVKAIVLDNANGGPANESPLQVARSGAGVTDQIQTIRGRRVPTAFGLGQPLAGVADQALTEHFRFQAGVSLILEMLQNSGGPVTLVTVGSLRDVAAAFNRQPALFKQKVARLLVFAGEAASTPAGLAARKQYQVDLDRRAFAAIMRSDLPVYWVPRQDGGRGAAHPNNAGHASIWTAPLGEALAPLSGPPLTFLVNALTQANFPVDRLIVYGVSPEDTMQVLTQSKDLWAAAALAAIIDKTVTFDGVEPALAGGLLQPPPGAVFGFSPVDVTVSDTGYVSAYGPGAGAHRVQRFDRLVDQDTYARAMTRMTAKMLARLGVSSRN